LSPSGNVITAGVVTISSGNSPINFNGKILSAANSSASLAINAGTGTVTIGDSVGINAITTATSGLPLTYALSNLSITAANIHILADVLTRNAQLYSGKVSIGDNGTQGALYAYYLTLLTSVDPLKPTPILLNPIYARTFISIDPSITFTSTVDDLVANTHSLYTAAITQVGANTPSIVFDGAVGKTNPFYSVNLLTMQISSPSAYVGTIQLSGEVDTFSDQSYRTNTLTADPVTPATTMTFTVDDPNAKIAFDLYVTPAPASTYELTNTHGADTLVFNGPTTFNGLTANPIFPTGSWTAVTMAQSLGAIRIAAAAAAAAAESEAAARARALALLAAQEVDRENALKSAVRSRAGSGSSDRNWADAGTTMNGYMNNNNFEVSKPLVDGSVKVSMGTPSGSTREVGDDVCQLDPDCRK
jgi:hypothetical protein